MTGTIKPLFSWRAALCDSDLRPVTRHVALALSLYMSERGDSAHPGPTRLAHDTGLNISTVKANLTILERSGWLRCVERGGLKGEKKRANEYVASVPDPALFIHNPALSAPGAVEYPSSSVRAPVAVDDPNSPKNSPITNTRDGQSYPQDAFESWWSGYPRKVDKAEARIRFTARLCQGVPLEELTAARDHYAASVAGSDLRFVKYAAVFLNGHDGPWSEWVAGPPAGTTLAAPAAGDDASPPVTRTRGGTVERFYPGTGWVAEQ